MTDVGPRSAPAAPVRGSAGTGPAPLPTVAVVLAGGSGRRLRTDVPKQLLEVGGRTVLEHTVAALHGCDGVSQVLVVMHEDHLREAERLLRGKGLHKVTAVVPGGADRTSSTGRALDALGDQECNVLLHDAARPLVSARVVRECIEVLATHRAVVVATRAVDTVLRVEQDDRVVDAPDRSRLWNAQTPQGFRLSVIRQAHALAERAGAAAATDDCTLVLRHLPEVVVHVVEGDRDNLKLTHPADLPLLELLLRARAERSAPIG